ncbi:acetylxylan esterase [Sphingobacterium alkalisoli]|uniref:Acetylxylan esterase n=2 Tax=Sphingobacterium alkalisoli TaxID=1874115 RepID=A0A4U0HA85_9SPHI|nr:acetylxylan esterase [Sphingobacterium alkalisoli]
MYNINLQQRCLFLKSIWIICFLLATSVIYGQSATNNDLKIVVSADAPNWTYEIGQEAVFKIQVYRGQELADDVDVSYTIGLEKMLPTEKGKLHLKSGEGTIKGKLSEAGFLRCAVSMEVDGTRYRGLATAGFAPEAIQPTQNLPDDFLDFWDKAKVEAARVPMEAELTLLPERGTESVDVYQVSFQHYEKGARLYGILAKPKNAGKYPAVLSVPGAGIRPYAGIVDLAEQGVVTLQIGIHGVPVTYDEDLYEDLRNGALKNYQFFNLDDRDKYYYKRVYLGCVRAVDYLSSLEEVDDEKMLVWGGSQGGALAIITAALDDRIKGLAAAYPALCDLTGYLHGRAGGWPHMFNESNAAFMVKEEKIKVSAYYDVVNFARYVKVPGLYSWGFNDETCPPTSYYAAYNMIPAVKEISLDPERGHKTSDEQNHKVRAWLLEKLGK